MRIEITITDGETSSDAETSILRILKSSSLTIEISALITVIEVKVRHANHQTIRCFRARFCQRFHDGTCLRIASGPQSLALFSRSMQGLIRSSSALCSPNSLPSLCQRLRCPQPPVQERCSCRRDDFLLHLQVP